MEKVVTSTRPGRALARRFVAGDTLDDAVAAARELNSSGLLVSLDHLGEEVHDRASAMQATEEYLESLDRIATEDLDSNISVKPTQLGLAIDEDLAMESIDLLARRAKKVGTSVTIDMEDSRYTDSTVRLYENAQAEHGNLGIAIQAYLHRTPQDLVRLVPLGGHIRLCKGAYVESEEVALTSNPEINAAFAEQMRTLMASEETKPAIATHDMSLLDLARALAAERNHPFEFQMLYGVRRELQKQLVTEGYPVRVYLPFGSQWYPYLTRRLAERPSNAWFLVRAAFGN
ncbi:MAG: proline dehydrogenase family protein [Acidimicrobiia bacterium]